MIKPQKIPIWDVIYTQNRIGYVFLDQLSDRMAPISALTQPAPLGNVKGSLANLPIELLLMVLDNLAITGVMRFRRCNPFAMHVADTQPALRFCLRIAPNAVKGMMAIRTSAHITAQQLRDKLRQRDCDGIRHKRLNNWPTNAMLESYQCGHLAQNIYLLTCTRLCVECVKTLESTQPLVN